MSDPRPLRRRLTTRYVFALSLIALLAVSAQVLVQYALAQQASDGHELNVAGRQRMLSQRIAKHALSARLTGDPAALDALGDDVAEWGRVHRALLDGAADRGLPAVADPAVRAALDSLSGTVAQTSAAAAALRRALAAGDDDGADRAVGRVMAGERAYLPVMDRAVFQLDRASEGSVHRLRWVEGALLALTLLVLALVGQSAFRPAAGRASPSGERARRGAGGGGPSPGPPETSATLVALRRMLIAGAVIVPAFWGVYQVVGSGRYVDPLALRLAFGGAMVVVWGLTYTSDVVRESIWSVLVAVACVLVGYFTWLTVLNGLEAVWVIGALAAGSGATIAVTPYSKSVARVWVAVTAVVASMAVSMVVSGGLDTNGVLLLSYFTVLALLVGFSAVAQVQTRDALRAGRDALRGRERLLRTVIDAIPEHVYVKDRDGRCLVRNRFSTDFMGLDDPSEAIGLTVFDTSHDPDVAAGYWEREDRVMRTGEPEIEHEEPFSFEGRTGWVVTSRVPLCDDDGAVVGLVGVTRDVSHRKAYEDTLEAQRRLLQGTIDALPLSVIVMDEGLRVVLANEAAGRLNGVGDSDGLIGHRPTDVLPPEAAGPIVASLRRVLETSSSGDSFEHPLEGEGNAGRTAETAHVPLRDAGGAVTGVIAVTRDVTVERESQAEVEAQRLLLRTVIDTIPDHIYVKDREGRATLRNVASARAVGAERPEDTLGQTDADTVADRGAGALADDLRVIETATAIRDKEEGGPDRSWLLTTKVPLRDADGEVVGLVGVSRDITAWKAAEAALREAKETAEAGRREVEDSQRLLQTVVDAFPDTVLVLDRDGRIVLLNQAGLDGTTFEAVEDVIGSTAEEAFRGEAGARIHRGRVPVFETGQPILRMKHPSVQPDGSPGVEETSRVPITDASGAVVGVLGVTRDVTAQQEAEAELVAARDAAEAATRAKSEFLANMSHEIRTPMNGVIGMTSLLMDTPLDREQRDFVETIRTSGDALLTIINDILDFSKIEAGMLSLEVHPFEVRTAVEEALDLVAQPAAEKGVELAYLIEDGVPRTVLGDVTRVRQVLVNLLSNAVKFTPAGSVCVRVDAAPPDAEAGSPVEVRFAVEDTGIGIAADKLDAVFESFSQADASTTRQFGGTGLGLTICRRLVDMMGGEVSVESALGSGSTFRFSVAAEVAASERRVFLRSEQPALEGRRVLVVDDNAVNREILTRLSARWRMRPEAVTSGPDALRAVADAEDRGRPYDLVLLDMQMPGMDGLDVARRLRDRDGRGPVVVMLTSIHREGDFRAEAEGAGVHRLLYKPTKPSQLYDALIDAFDGRPDAPPAPLAADPAETAWIARPAGPAPEAPAPDGPTVRILLAEDNVVNQKVAVRLLGRLGLTADVAANGAEALAAVERLAAFGEGYDVVFMDVQMPEMDGHEATRRIRSSPEVTGQPWIIALTANAMEGDREACLAAGADDYLSKPVQLESIRGAVERAAQGRVAARESVRA